MKKKSLIVFLILFTLINLFDINYANGISSKPKYINIKLSRPIKNKYSINLYSEEGFSIYYKDNLSREIEDLNANNLRINLVNGELIISNEYEDLFYLEDYEDIVIGSSNGHNSIIKVEDNYYRGYIFFKTHGNEIIPINYLSLEEYLYGVIPREMPAYFNMEALKAQAIASRTYALHNINKHIGEGYNLCDITHCQVYGGMAGEHERTNKAVDETYGMVIEYYGEIIDAVYHSNSGGHTRDSKEVWGGYLPYLIGVEDKYSEGVTNSNWSFSINSSELSKRLINNGIDIGYPLKIEVVERTPSGRVLRIKVLGQYGEEILSESQYKQIFGANNLRTTWFSIEREGEFNEKNFYVVDYNSPSPRTININNSYVIHNVTESKLLDINRLSIIDKNKISTIDNRKNLSNGDFVIYGKGFGHGVGMSQWGANGMANEGYDFYEILKHYYTDVDINQIY